MSVDIGQLVATAVGGGVILGGVGYGVAQVRKGKLNADQDIIGLANAQLELLKRTGETQADIIASQTTRIETLEARALRAEDLAREYLGRIAALETEVHYLRELIGGALSASGVVLTPPKVSEG